MDRLKKLGGSVPYTYFMTNEMSAMQAILEEIRSTLSAIKTSIDQPAINSPTVSLSCRITAQRLYFMIPSQFYEINKYMTSIMVFVSIT